VCQEGALADEQLAIRQQNVVKFELKFQNELDNSTTIKQVGQQQIFKCQVRLAPSGQHGAQHKGRLRSDANLLELSGAAKPEEWSPSENGFTFQENQARSRWPLLSNVSIHIDWLRDEEQINRHQEGEFQWGDFNVSVINVTLNKTTTSNSIFNSNGQTKPVNKHQNDKNDQWIGQNYEQQQQQQQQPSIHNKHRNAGNGPGQSLGWAPNRSRIEIKNTLNEHQLKLTSRLKLTSLRKIDSASYKCRARAHFRQQLDEIGPQRAANQLQVLDVDQLLESNRVSHLSVVDIGTRPEKATLDQGKSRARFSVCPPPLAPIFSLDDTLMCRGVCKEGQPLSPAMVRPNRDTSWPITFWKIPISGCEMECEQISSVEWGLKSASWEAKWMEPNSGHPQIHWADEIQAPCRRR